MKSDPKDAVVHLRLTETEKDEFTSLARREGTSLSGLIRRLLKWEIFNSRKKAS